MKVVKLQRIKMKLKVWLDFIDFKPDDPMWKSCQQVIPICRQIDRFVNGRWEVFLEVIPPNPVAHPV
jgi:hypothetical protein